MKYGEPITFLIMALCAAISIWFVSEIKPASINAFLFFAAWLIAPYVILTAVLVFLRPKNRLGWLMAAALVSIGGILFLSDVIFWHKDAQGAIAVIMTPLFQFAGLLVSLPLVMWVSRHVRT